MVAILFLKSNCDMTSQNSRTIKYNHLMNFSEKLHQNENEYMILINELTADDNENNYLEMWQLSSSPERIAFLRS